MKKLNFATAICMSFVIYFALAINLHSQTLTVLYNFDGSSPTAALIQGTDGNFYSTMAGGEIGFEGNVYKLTPSGTYTSLYTFCCQNGQFPFGPLLLATNGYFYGTTQQGGTAFEGNIYKITAGGTETSLYSFCTTDCSDGASPGGQLIQVGSGGIYGATTSTIFKITLAGMLTTLYNFCPTPTSCNKTGPPAPSGLVLGQDGNFYGVTGAGGTSNLGTVFKLTPSGTLTTLHNFSGSDGANPVGPLVQGRGGFLYGVTFDGGTGTASECAEVGSCGTIFRISPSGAFTTLHDFDGTDGANPYAWLILATDGNLYGTTGFGGGNGTNSGTIFQISQAGKFTNLYNFCSQTFCLDGVYSRTPLLQDTNGTLYGTAGQGGTQTDGTFFSFSMGLGPFVETIPTTGKIGTPVAILGNGLTGATSVTFNGTTAAFTVVSDTEITATVPTGATMGTVQVTTPGGTLSSNLPFRVPH
jgi:uncharacterized repeat protein (TIGR03803 family)